MTQVLHTVITCKQNLENVILCYVLGCFASDIHSAINRLTLLASVVTKFEASCQVCSRETVHSRVQFWGHDYGIHRRRALRLAVNRLCCKGRAGTDA